MENHRCWAEIDLNAIRGNAAVAHERMGPGSAIMGIIKADAYGHGIIPVAKTLEPHVAFLGVASVLEALQLKPHLEDATRLFLLGPVLPEKRALVVEHDFVPFLSTLDEASHYHQLAADRKKRLCVHLAIDTGMGRIGFTDSSLTQFLRAHGELNNLEIEGIASHFPSADEDREFTLSQIKLFDRRLEECRQAGLHPGFVHIANSAGILAFNRELRGLLTGAARSKPKPDPAGAPTQVALGRPGLMLYGLSPLPDNQEALRPALSLKTRVTLIRDLPRGHGISYGGDYVTEKRNTSVATLGIGYGDGYPRGLSGRGTEVLIRGQRCRLLGRVTMDQIMVDVSDLDNPARVGDEAVLIGAQGAEAILATEIAEKAGSIVWEILTRITSRVHRVYLPQDPSPLPP